MKEFFSISYPPVLFNKLRVIKVYINNFIKKGYPDKNVTNFIKKLKLRNKKIKVKKKFFYKFIAKFLSTLPYYPSYNYPFPCLSATQAQGEIKRRIG